MAKSKWDDAEKPTVNISRKSDQTFFNMFFEVRIDRSITYQPKLTVILLGDKCPPGHRLKCVDAP